MWLFFGPLIFWFSPASPLPTGHTAAYTERILSTRLLDEGRVRGGAPGISGHSQLAISQYLLCVRFVFLSEQQSPNTHAAPSPAPQPEMMGQSCRAQPAKLRPASKTETSTR